MFPGQVHQWAVGSGNGSGKCRLIKGWGRGGRVRRVSVLYVPGLVSLGLTEHVSCGFCTSQVLGLGLLLLYFALLG
jgi:hypothetical protein